MIDPERPSATGRSRRTIAALQWQLDTIWDLFRERLTGLGDEEYFWEPVPDCWTVRRAGDSWTVDWAYPPPDPPPVTTIAWRLNHVELEFLIRLDYLFGPRTLRVPEDITWHGSAAGAVESLRKTLSSYRSGMETLIDDDLDRAAERIPSGTEPRTVRTMIAWMNIEFAHHAAEVACLRDLYRAFPLTRASPRSR